MSLSSSGCPAGTLSSPSCDPVTVDANTQFSLAVARLPLQLFIIRAREVSEHMANLLQLLRAALKIAVSAEHA